MCAVAARVFVKFRRSACTWPAGPERLQASGSLGPGFRLCTLLCYSSAFQHGSFWPKRIQISERARSCWWHQRACALGGACSKSRVGSGSLCSFAILVHARGKHVREMCRQRRNMTMEVPAYLWSCVLYMLLPATYCKLCNADVAWDVGPTELLITFSSWQHCWILAICRGVWDQILVGCQHQSSGSQWASVPAQSWETHLQFGKCDALCSQGEEEERVRVDGIPESYLLADRLALR